MKWGMVEAVASVDGGKTTVVHLEGELIPDAGGERPAQWYPEHCVLSALDSAAVPFSAFDAEIGVGNQP